MSFKNVCGFIWSTHYDKAKKKSFHLSDNVERQGFPPTRNRQK